MQGLTGASRLVLQHWGRLSRRPAAAFPNRAASGLFEKVSVARTAPFVTHDSAAQGQRQRRQVLHWSLRLPLLPPVSYEMRPA